MLPASACNVLGRDNTLPVCGVKWPDISSNHTVVPFPCQPDLHLEWYSALSRSSLGSSSSQSSTVSLRFPLEGKRWRKKTNEQEGGRKGERSRG